MGRNKEPQYAEEAGLLKLSLL